MYANATGQDILGIRQLAWVIEYLQRAAIVHEARCETYGYCGESMVALIVDCLDLGESSDSPKIFYSSVPIRGAGHLHLPKEPKC